jgi:hypothetical protein
LSNHRGFYQILHKLLALFSILILGAGCAGGITLPTPTSQQESSPVSAPSQGAHLTLVSSKHRHKSKSKHKSKRKKVRGQTAIRSDRAREIQTALIRKGYLKGEPSGVWDQPTKDAMTRYQADHGWQTKTLPDSRALIELGLGPNHEDAINAKAISANLPPPAEPVKNSALPENRQ